jgi:hypothetical protein
MMKKIVSLVAVLALAMAITVSSAFAADVPVVTYDGGSQLTYTDASGNAISGDADFGTAFSSMLPGVTYTQEIQLRNTSLDDTVRYYMDMSVLQTLKNAGLDGAGYTVTLTSNGETLYSSVSGTVSGTLVGGSNSTGELADLNEDFYSSDGQGILVATLKPGETATLALSIAADATMSNAYQDAEGVIQFQFFGEIVPVNTPTPNIVQKTVYVNKGVKTGDSSPIYIVAAVLVVAVVALVVIGIVKKKNKKA